MDEMDLMDEMDSVNPWCHGLDFSSDLCFLTLAGLVLRLSNPFSYSHGFTMILAHSFAAPSSNAFVMADIGMTWLTSRSITGDS